MNKKQKRAKVQVARARQKVGKTFRKILKMVQASENGVSAPDIAAKLNNGDLHRVIANPHKFNSSYIDLVKQAQDVLVERALNLEKV